MRAIQRVAQIHVGLDFGEGELPLGRLALHQHQIYFEYHSAFMERKLPLSPFHLPLKPGLQHFERHLFEGLPGVFNDSLPDGWGRLLFDRFARSQNILPAELSPLDRLAHVGVHGLGALVYQPDLSPHEHPQRLNLDQLAAQAQKVLLGECDEVIAELMALNGSSAGARPKALIGLNPERSQMVYGRQPLQGAYTPWIVKFCNRQDGADAGAIEYVYALMAQDAGIAMPPVHLFPAQRGAGYFAVQRFDRKGPQRQHMHSAAGLLHSDFRQPALDYENLTTLTGMLTRDVGEIENMYRLAVFNVLSHNRDDHGKNVSFLMDKHGQWRLSPAYDLTFSSGPGGEQSTTVMGEGRRPGVEHLLALAKAAQIDVKQAKHIIQKTQSSLSKWAELASHYGVSNNNRQLIGARLANSAKA